MLGSPEDRDLLEPEDFEFLLDIVIDQRAWFNIPSKIREFFSSPKGTTQSTEILLVEVAEPARVHPQVNDLGGATATAGFSPLPRNQSNS